MRFFSPLLILVALLAAACGGAAVLPDEFTRERADGKIPVSIPLIRQQTKKEIDGMPEGQAKVERWQQIEKDHNQCRLLSARSSRAEANEVFAACMSKREYVYMHRLDAEQLHDDVATAEKAKHAAEKKAKEEERLAANKKTAQEKKDADLIDKVGHGNTAKVRALLNAGANPNATRSDGNPALMEAARNGYAEVIKILLDAGANVNAVNPAGSTALFHAARSGVPQALRILLAAGANVNATSRGGWTPLLGAAQNASFTRVAKILLAAGANVDATQDDGFTALIVVARHTGIPEAAKILLAAGANVHAADNDGSTALIWAAGDGRIKLTEVLLAAGANVNAADEYGWTALLEAAHREHVEVVKILLAAGAEVDAASKYGKTALIRAAEQGNMKMIKMLVAAGANPDLDDSDGFNAWYYAQAWGNEEVAAIRKAVNERRSVDGSPPIKPTNAAAYVFENVWQNIVLIRQGKKQGSGVIVSPNVVATNCHVVDSYGDIVIYKHDNRRATTDTRYRATIRRRDTARDFCLLDVAGLQGIPANARRYHTLNIGEDVYAVGSPKGLGLSLSSGIISQLRQEASPRYIQTDAAISPGSSGGGLFDSDGNLIGILTRKIADEEVEGIGFAIPAELVLNL